ncbi:hypothetical protein LSM04_005935 [Trypanosoma melophagium]|uniref:uncharacterized protein n=1 Tax=Trypanosoma melophagium TaxID=715481 RepID=UPI003519F26D|nr:hypothetical protein LSM04_005935 [Trypanosoma melophagium]
MTNLPKEDERESFRQIVRTLPSMLSALLQHKQQQQGDSHHTSRTVALVSQLHRMLVIAVQLLMSPETDHIEFERASVLLNQESGTFFDILRRILLIHTNERELFNSPVILSIPDVQLECLQLLLRLFSDAFHSIRSVEFMQYLKTITPTYASC